MASQRWVSDMQSHHAMPSGLGLQVGDGITADVTVDNVVPLFAPRVGSLAELVAAAAGPTEPRELLGESEIRANFRAVMLEAPPSVRRRHKLAPFAIAAGSVAGLVAGTAGLSAAAVLPPAANHVVAQVLRQVGIDVAPAKSVSPASALTRTSGTQAHQARQARPPRGSNQSPATVTAVSTPKTTTPPKTRPAATSPVRCEVAVIQGHVVLVPVSISATTGQAIPIANAVPLAPPGPCANRRATQLENAAGTAGSSTGPVTTVPVTTVPVTTGGTGGTGTGGPGTGTGGTGKGTNQGGSGGTGTGGSGTGKGTNQGGSGGKGTGKGTNHGGGKGHHGGKGGSTTGTTTPPSSSDPSGSSATGSASTSTTNAP
jgi:hypothetical protein